MINNKRAPLPGLLSGSGIVEFELSKPHSAPKYPFIISNQKREGGKCAVTKYTNAYKQNELQVHVFIFRKAFFDSKRRHFTTIMIRHSSKRVNLQGRN